MDFNIEVPLGCSVSFGQVSFCILREIWKRDFQPCIFPISNQVDTRAFEKDADFDLWLNSCIQKAKLRYNRSNPSFHLWHLDGSELGIGNKRLLLTFHECDAATETETNIVKNHEKVLFGSSYSKGVFQTFGCDNVDNVPLGFDSYSFHRITDRQYVDAGVIQMGIFGKLERRKAHARIINLWVKRYGNNPKYKLNCSLYNPFLPVEVQNNLVVNAMEGKNFWNVNFLPFTDSNLAFNDVLNSNSIVIGMSHAESWGLPEFQSTALGKHSLILNATGYRDWATPENSVLVNPTGKIQLYDGVFFREGHNFSQGSGFDWKDEQFYEGLEKVIARFEKNPVNESGLELAQTFTYEKTVDKILDTIKNI